MAPSVKTKRVGKTTARVPEGLNDELLLIGVVRYRVAGLHELEDLSHGGLTLYVGVKHLRATIAGDLDQP
jgi:hypothetical protein